LLFTNAVFKRNVSFTFKNGVFFKSKIKRFESKKNELQDIVLPKKNNN